MLHKPLLFVIIALLALLGSVASGQSPVVRADQGDDTVIRVCKNNASGTMKVVGEDESCKKGETAIHLLIVGAGGNVGIGVPTPTVALDVLGSIRASEKVFASVYASNSPLIFEAPAGSERARIDDITGNMGLGTTSPAANLEIRGNNTDELRLSNAQNARYVVFRSAVQDINSYGIPGNSALSLNNLSSENVLIATGGGNLGVGATSPGAKLEVACQVKITGGAPGAGKVLTSDSAGLGSWQTPSAGVDGDWTISGNNMFSAVSGNVGIGTTSPNEQLEITGNFRLPSSTATSGVIKSGGNRFIHNFGIDNFFAGVLAGNLAETGLGGNTGVGVRALRSNTTGQQNTAIGLLALDLNNGSLNTATGNRALESNSTGSNNTGFGTYALQTNTTGNLNTAVGQSALGFNTTGTKNTALGFFANPSVGNLTNATAIGAFAQVDASNKIQLGDGNVTLVETAGDVYSLGIILRDSDGPGCHRITVNTAGLLAITAMACP